MVAPITVRFRHDVVAPPVASPLRVVLMATNTGGLAPVNVFTAITPATASDQLGAGTDKLAIFNYVNDQHFFILPWEHDAAASTLARNINTAIAALGDADKLAAMGGVPPHIVLIPGIATGATDADDHIAAIKAIGARADFGFAIFTDTPDTQADAITWENNNGGGGVLGMTNRQNIPGLSGASGSIIAAGHYARHAALEGLGASPTGLSYPLAGVSGTPTPVRAFSLSDATAAAEVLDDNHLTSIITHNGQFYLWGGKTQPDTTGSPLENVGNRILAYELVRVAQNAMAPLVGGPATESRLEAAALRGSAAVGTYVGQGALTAASIGNVTVVGLQVRAEMALTFAPHVDSVLMDVPLRLAA